MEQFVDKTCAILENGFKDDQDEALQRNTMMFFYSKKVKIWLILAIKIPFLRKICVWRLKKWLPYYDRLLQYHSGRFMYRTHYLFPSRFRNLIHALAGDIEPDEKTGLYGDIQHEWDICMETPDLFDARETIRNRLEQIKFLEIRGFVDDNKMYEDLASILCEMEKLRKDPEDTLSGGAGN